MADSMERPADFAAYWEAVDRALERLPGRPVLERRPEESTGFCTVYGLKLTSVGPYRIFGFYSVPKGEGPFPAILQTPRYGSVNHISDYNDRQRYVCLQLMHRGQRLADQPFAAEYPGLLTRGIADPGTYIYRDIVADCLRSAEFLLSQPVVDPSRVAVIGDDLALITAARRPRFTVDELAGLVFYRLAEALPTTSEYPIEEVNDYLRAHPDRRRAVERTLSYFDPRHHAPDVTATTILSVGGDGTTSGLPWLRPLVDALGGPVEPYRLTNEGGNDHDRLDAMLATRFGVEPMSRFRRVFA